MFSSNVLTRVLHNYTYNFQGRVCFCQSLRFYRIRKDEVTWVKHSKPNEKRRNNCLNPLNITKEDERLLEGKVIKFQRNNELCASIKSVTNEVNTLLQQKFSRNVEIESEFVQFRMVWFCNLKLVNVSELTFKGTGKTKQIADYNSRLAVFSWLKEIGNVPKYIERISNGNRNLGHEADTLNAVTRLPINKHYQNNHVGILKFLKPYVFKENPYTELSINTSTNVQKRFFFTSTLCNNNKSNSDLKLEKLSSYKKSSDIFNNIIQNNEQEIVELDSKVDCNVINSNLNKTAIESRHFQIGSSSKFHHIHEKYSNPTGTLHNFYQMLSSQLNERFKAECFYKSHKTKPGIEWVCTYHLKWPEPCKISAKDQSKKRARTLAALKSLAFLSECGKISSDGTPLIYTNEEVKKLTQRKEHEINIEKGCLEKMQNIINVFNQDIKPFLNAVNYNYEEIPTEIIDKSERMNFSTKSLRCFEADEYLAQEKKSLPISSLKEHFIDLLQKNNCVIVKGEPGCGKSTRVPQYVLESWARQATFESDLCRVAVTQPRRIAAISLAQRVASERDENVGYIVGYQVRLKSNFQLSTGRILYCTTGILLRHLQSDPNLHNFSHVILDEAHERDVNTDVLMNLLKKALRENDKLKLIVMSATIDADKFSSYFGGAPILNVPGFTYPVKQHYLESCKFDVTKTFRMCKGDIPQVVHEDVVKVIKFIHRTKREGAILVFLPGWEDLTKVQKMIQYQNNVVVHLVHSMLKDSEQSRIFSRPPPGVRKVILATNIAETSITIDDVVYVVDTGIHKDQVFDNDKGISVIDMEWISKSSANQRAGRAGRCAPGEAYHLYSKERFRKFQDYAPPKILNSSLTKVVLDSKLFANNVTACDFMNSLITPPEKLAVERAVDELKQLDLLDEHEKLTPLGKTLVNFQMEPNLAKTMVNSVVFKCATPIVDIITLFSSDTKMFGSSILMAKEEVKNVKKRYSESSDHLALMRMYEKWFELKEQGQYAAEEFCADANLIHHKMNFIEKLKNVHFDYLYNGLHNSMPITDDLSDNDELVKAVLYSGTGKILTHRNWDMVKKRLKTNVNVLVTRNNHKATITSDSVNHKKEKFPSDFLIYINETRSNIRRLTLVRECSFIPAISVLLFTNQDLELLTSKSENNPVDDSVTVTVKNTNLKFVFNQEQAEVLFNCKNAIKSSYKYLIHQLTYAREDLTEFMEHWNEVLRNLSRILNEHKIK